MAEDARSHPPFPLNRAMDALLRLRLDALRAQLVCSRLEKMSLQAGIACATTEKWKKENAMFRYLALVAELRKISCELDVLQGKR
jgi:hypothetical protein